MTGSQFQHFLLNNQDKNSAQNFLPHEKSQFILIGSIVLLISLLYARDLFEYDISKFELLTAAIIPAIFMNHASLVYYTFFLLPLSSGLPGNYLYPLLILLMLVKKPKAVDQSGLLCFIVITLCELINNGFYSIPLQESITIGYLTTIFFLCYIATLKASTVSNSKCILFYCLGALLFLLAIWYITQINNDIEMLLERGERIGETKKVTDRGENVLMLTANPNQLGYISLTGESLILVLYYMHILPFWSMMLFSVLFVYIGALSVSRTWLLGIILLGLLLAVFIRQLNTRRKKNYYLTLFSLIGIGIYAFFKNNLILESFSRRFTEEDISSVGFRITIFKEYNKVLMDNPIYFLFGAGGIHYRNVITEIHLTTHNGIQQILVAYGLIGLILFTSFTVQAIKRNYRKSFLICNIPFIIAFFFVQSGQLLYPYHSLDPFIVSFVAMRLNDDSNTSITYFH